MGRTLERMSHIYMEGESTICTLLLLGGTQYKGGFLHRQHLLLSVISDQMISAIFGLCSEDGIIFFTVV